MKILNAISLNMLPSDVIDASLKIRRLRDVTEAAYLILHSSSEPDGCIGHPSTAAVINAALSSVDLVDDDDRGNSFSTRLPDVRHERKTVVLEEFEPALVAQYIGPRLPEGATTLPAGARIEWFEICLEPKPKICEAACSQCGQAMIDDELGDDGEEPMCSECAADCL